MDGQMDRQTDRHMDRGHDIICPALTGIYFYFEF